MFIDTWENNPYSNYMTKYATAIRWVSDGQISFWREQVDTLEEAREQQANYPHLPLIIVKIEEIK